MEDYYDKNIIFHDWFTDGIHRGARYMIIILDKMEMEMRPIFIFPEQDIYIEVIRRMEDELSEIIGVMDLLDDADRQICSALLKNTFISISKVVN